MAFKIESNPVLGQRTDASGYRINSDKPGDSALAEALNGKRSSFNADSQVKTISSAASKEEAATLTLSNLKNFVDTAKNAIESIASLRAEQLKLAKKADSSPQDSYTSTLDSELQTLQSEITRVQSQATFNGKNVLESTQTLTAVIDSGKITERSDAVTIGSATSLTANYNLSLTSPSGASSAVTTLANLQGSIETFSGSLDSASGKVAAINSLTTPTPAKQQIDKYVAPLSTKDARELSKDVAYEISSPFNADQQKARIIETSSDKLDADKVLALLEE